MTNWKDCKYYQEMYDLRDTWNELLPCSRKVLDRPDTCDGCQLLNGCNSKDILCPYIKITLETAKAAISVFEVLKELTKNHPENTYSKDIDKHLDELKQAVNNV